MDCAAGKVYEESASSQLCRAFAALGRFEETFVAARAMLATRPQLLAALGETSCVALLKCEYTDC
jgi:hypothetical protein